MNAKKTAARTAAKPSQPRKSAAASRAKPHPAAGIGSIDELMAYAYALELEASERYADFADAMEIHNNREVAELFRKLARIESRHADQVLEEMGWSSPPPRVLRSG